MKKEPVAQKPALKTYRVYVAQINQAMVEVKARNKNEAGRKGYAQWRREYSHSEVLSVEEQA